MQRQGDKLDMPGGFKNAPVTHTNDTLYGTSSTADPTPIASAMRSSNVVNPHESAYEVAGPSMGGSPSIHNRALDAVKGQTLHDPAGPISSGGTPAHSLPGTAMDNTTAVTGAAAAGASAIAAVKNLLNTNTNSRSDNEFGHPRVDTTTIPHAIANSSNSPTSISSPQTSSVTSSSPSLSQPKPLGPNDRPPIRVAIHAQKPSDKATYGNLDSPGAHHHAGPLSDRALAGTPPPSALPLPRTIADPFGPVKVTNWNDGKRQTDVSTPTSEDFDSPHFSPVRDRPEKSFTAPGSAPATHTAKRLHNPSPLKEEVPVIKKASATATDVNHPLPSKEYFPHVQHASTMTGPQSHNKEPLGERIKEAFHYHHNPTTAASSTTPTALHNTKEPLGERIKEAFHLESHPTVEVPIKVNTSTIATSSAAPEIFTNKTEYVPVENLRDIDISKVAEQASHQFPYTATTTTKTTVTETTTPVANTVVHGSTAAIPHKEPLGERIKEAFQHDSHPTAVHSSVNPPYKEPLGERIRETFQHESHPTVEVPIKVNTATIAATSAAPEIFTNKIEYVPVENLRDIDISKITQTASHQPTATTSGITKTTVTETTKIKPVDHKESIVDRVKDVFHHDSSASTTARHNANHAPMVVEKHHEPIVASTTGTATHTAENESLIDRVKDVFRRDSSETHFASTKTAAPVTVAAAAGTAAGVAAFLHDTDNDNATVPPKAHDHRAYLAPGVKSSITPTTTGPEHAAAAVPAAVVDPLEIKSHVFKPVDSSPLKKHTAAPAPVFDTKYMDTSAVAPVTTAAAATLSNTSHTPVAHAIHTTTSHTPVAPVVQTTTTTTKPVNGIQFTDPTTLRPLTGTSTWEIPPPADHRSITNKVKDAIGLHTASEYGPADPKDLSLSDPNSLHHGKDIAPVAAVAATAAATAAAVAPMVHKATTTTTTSKNTPVAPIVPVVHTTTTTPAVAAKPAGEILFTDPTTLRPLTGNRTWEIPPVTDHRTITTKVKDAIGFHTASEYGPADPKDLHLSDPKTLGLMKDVAPMAAVATTAAATAAAVAPMVNKTTTTTTPTNTPVAPVVPVVHTTTTAPAVTAKSVNGIQFTDPTTLRPLTGTRTWEIPPPADHRGITTKVKDAVKLHSASEYGPADPKDLPLSDPKSLRLLKDIAPVAAVAATAAAVVPMLNKSSTTTTTAMKEEHNPVLTAPHPVIPATSSVSKTEFNPVHTAPHPVIPATSSISKSELNTVQMAPRPVIPAATHVEALSSHAVKDAPHPVIPPVVTTEKTHHHMEPNPVLAAPRPVIPAVTEKSTTTTHHADSAPKIAHVAVPIVAAAAAVPIVENARTTTTTTSHDNKPNVVQSASRPIIPVVTPAPVVQQQQYQQAQQPTSYSATTNSYNSAPIQQQRQQQQVNTQRASATEIEFADKIAAAIPESYHGAIPNLQPGEEIVWVKTVTTTDYYDDNSPPVVTHINNTVAAGGPGGNANPAPLGVPANAVHDNSTQRRSSGGFLDRLTHRHHDNVDKGKQRM